MKTTTPNVGPHTETRYREERIGHGILKIEEQYIDGKLFSSVFTLESLAHVLGMPMSTIEGRYKRARLSRWMVPVRQYNGRPARGFPYALLEQVMYAIEHPHAVVVSDDRGSSVQIKSRNEVGELVPEYFGGEPYYTVPALARAFGYSETTIRKKLQVAGLARHFKNLTAPVHGGRPKRGIPERYLAQVKLAVTDGADFRDSYNRVMYQTSGAMKEAKQQMKAAVVAHTPPSNLQAWDAGALAPVSRTSRHVLKDDDPALKDLMASVDSALAMQADLPPMADDNPTQPVNDVNSRFDTMPTDEQARKAEQEQEAANRAALVPVQRQMLIDDEREPTDEELDDTCYALDLTGQARAEFIRSVREGRAARLGSAGK